MKNLRAISSDVTRISLVCLSTQLYSHGVIHLKEHAHSLYINISSKAMIVVKCRKKYMHVLVSYNNNVRVYIPYIAGKFGGKLNLALWRIDQPTANILYIRLARILTLLWASVRQF